jgi:hypothetical protein
MTISTILSRLSPTNPVDFPFGFVLYTIIILAIVNLFLQKNAGLLLTLLISAVILAAIVDHVATTNSLGGYSGDYFAPLMVRVSMFVFPLISAGITKQEKSRPFAIVGAVIALSYWIIRYTQIPK